MPWVKFGHRIKYNGQFYEAGKKIKVEDPDLPALKEAGAEEVESRAGRPRKQTESIEV